MTQAFNLSQLANNVNSAGELAGSAIDGAVAEAQSISTTNFTIVESGGKLLIKYGATTIASIDSAGNFVTVDNVTAYGTP
jgi:hypothetical protein